MQYKATSNEETEKDPQQLLSLTVDKHLFASRTVLITGSVNEELALDVCRSILAMSHVSQDPINVFVCSPGGHVESGDMIHDIIKFVSPKIRMIGVGWVASAGALIYVSAPKEQRFCLPNTRFLLHQPSGGAGGPATEIEIQAREILKTRDRLNNIFATATGQSVERIATDTDRDFWMSPREAIEYGLVSRVITNISEISST